jgi:hypothetical protein
MARNKTAAVGLKFEPSLKKALEKAAADDRRSVASLVEKLVVDYLTTNGYVGRDDGKGA